MGDSIGKRDSGRSATVRGARFPREMRLQRNRDFQQVMRRRRSASNYALIIYASPNGLPYSRLGLTVSRRVGPAVVRHQWKRHLREVFRCRRGEMPVGYDIVAIPRPGSVPSHRIVDDSLPRLVDAAVRRVKAKR